MKRYLYYSSLLSVFTEAFVIRSTIDIKLFYFVALINLLILTAMKSIYISQKLILFYIFLILSGLISIALGTNTPRLFLSQFFGITMISLFFYNFFTLFKDKVPKIFKDYTTISYYLAIIGILMFVYYLFKGIIAPVKSLLLEPAHYVTIVLPAFFYSIRNKEFPRHIWKIILVSIVLSGSSLGILGVALSILLIPNRIRLLRLAISFVVAATLFVISYNNFEPLKLRVDDSVKAVEGRNLKGVNLSTFFLASNFYVAVKSLENNPVLGSGLGSHELSHEKYIYWINGIEEFTPYLEINASDAASYFIRIMSEFGLLGIILLFIFLIKNYVGYSTTVTSNSPLMHLISKAVLLYFFCKLFREGHHFPPELYFFVFAYIFSSRLALSTREVQQ